MTRHREILRLHAMGLKPKKHCLQLQRLKDNVFFATYLPEIYNDEIDKKHYYFNKR